MCAAVAAWNALSGVATRFSCQGVSGLVTYKGRQILVVSPHEACAYTEFASIANAAAGAVYDLAADYPTISVVGSGHCHVTDTRVPKNVQSARYAASRAAP